MMTVCTLPFREVWAVDFEYQQDDGEKPIIHCLVALELKTGRLLRIWEDELRTLSCPPYDIGPDSLFVAYTAPAEFSCHLVLGWELPVNVLDPYVEFRNRVSGHKPFHGHGLLGAMLFYGLKGIEAFEKEGMRSLAIRGGPFTASEKLALFDYCETDVRALEKLLPRMLPDIELAYALIRGRYTRAVAYMVNHGVPLDMDILTEVKNHWPHIRSRLIEEIDRSYGVYENGSFRESKFLQWCWRNQVQWPRLESGRPELRRNTFRDMAKIYPQVAPLYELRTTLSDLREIKLQVGADGRNRTFLNQFGSRTSRNQPSSTKFIFGNAKWLRSFIKPPVGHGIAYIDFGQQEFAIAAVFSGDKRMIEAYQSDDPYLTFAKLAKAVPPDATKQSHKHERNLFKQCMLAVNYGMGPTSLAEKISESEIVSRSLLRTHQQTFPQFWRWSEDVLNYTMIHSVIQTSFGWNGRPGKNPNGRSIRNFPVQAAGAEIMRLAACGLAEAGIRIVAPVHDAFLIEAPLDQLDCAIVRAREIMADAGMAVLGNLRLKTDVEVVRYPDRYMDERGTRMWQTVMTLLSEARGKQAGGIA